MLRQLVRRAARKSRHSGPPTGEWHDVAGNEIALVRRIERNECRKLFRSSEPSLGNIPGHPCKRVRIIGQFGWKTCRTLDVIRCDRVDLDVVATKFAGQ